MPFGGGGEGEGGNGGVGGGGYGGNGGGDYGGGYGGNGDGGGEFGGTAGSYGGASDYGGNGYEGGGEFGGRGTNASAGGLGGWNVTTGDLWGSIFSAGLRAAEIASGPLGMLAGYAFGKGYDATFGSDDAPVGTVNFSGVTSSMSDFSSSGTPEAPGDAEGPEGRGRERARAYVRARSQFKDESPPGTTQLNIVSGGGTVPTIPRRSAIKSKGPISSRQNFVNRLGATAVNDIENPATTSTGAII